ncbi:hypothetical protein QZH41_005024 [Actinostola sp. cb2023]|nr:hypothetical protein QZH41_005024 [Actinostola sp. cb2023]
MATICEILNMPQPMSTQAWNDHTNALYETHKTAVEEHLDSSRARLRQKLKVDNPSITDDDIIDIAVTYDGTWSKRGHTANYGFGFVISVDTGEVLDYGFKSKLCWECSNQTFDEDSDDYRQWYESHKADCFQNFDGSSGNMEVAIIAQDVWNRSSEFNLRYKYMVCDGDSRAYTAVWDVYGCCDICAHYENLDRQNKEYKAWILTDAYSAWIVAHEEESVDCYRAIKLDCIGHVQKRIGTALRELKKKTKGKLADEKAVGGRGHRLFETNFYTPK